MVSDLIKRWIMLILILVVGLLVVRTCMRKMHESTAVMPNTPHNVPYAIMLDGLNKKHFLFYERQVHEICSVETFV